jgi:hypothetical protein
MTFKSVDDSRPSTLTSLSACKTRSRCASDVVDWIWLTIGGRYV